MIARPVTALAESDLDNLVANGVTEDKTLEFKQDLSLDGSEARKEFLADISSLANAVGGDLVIGVTEGPGAAAACVSGIEVTDWDDLRQRLESLVRDGISPRLPSLQLGQVPLKSGRSVVIARVLQSWLAPHRVIVNGHGHFYSRNSSGKYRMDVDELRHAFVSAARAHESALKLHQHRLFTLKNGAIGGIVAEEPALVIHVVPLVSTTALRSFDISLLPSLPADKLLPLSGVGWDRSFTIDGYRTWAVAPGEDSREPASMQVFRTGVVELADQVVIKGQFAAHQNRAVVPARLESKIIKWLEGVRAVLELLGVPPPAVVIATVYKCKGVIAHVRSFPEHAGFVPRPLAEDQITLPAALLQDWKGDIGTALRPAFDGLWNAFGLPRCPNYDNAGVWRAE